MEINSWDVQTPEQAAAIAAGTLVLRAVRPPRVDEGQTPGCTALGFELPPWARPNVRVMAPRPIGGPAILARVLAVGERCVLLEWADGTRGWRAWEAIEPAPAVSA